MIDMGVNCVNFANGEELIDFRDITVHEDVLFQGYTAINAQGVKIAGRAIPNGGSSTNEVEWVSCKLNLQTMVASDFSHTYEEICELSDQKKLVKLSVDYNSGIANGDLSAVNKEQGSAYFQLMVQANLGSGLMLVYFNVQLKSNGSSIVDPYIVNTTGLGG